MGVLIKLALVHQNQAELLLVRGLLAAVVVALLARARGVTLNTSMPWTHARRCAVGVVALSCWFYAIGKLPLATAFTLYFSSSLWVAGAVVLGAVWASYAIKANPEHPQAAQAARSNTDWALATMTTKGMVCKPGVAPRDRAKAVLNRQLPLIACIGLGFFGVMLALSPSASNAQSVAKAPSTVALLIGVAAGAVSAWAYTHIAALGKLREPTERVVFYFSAATALLGLLLLPVLGVSPWSPRHALCMLGAASLALVGQWAMTRAYASGSPLLVANLQFGSVPLAGLLGVLVFGEYLSLLAWLGIATIIASAALSVAIRKAQDSRLENQKQ